MVILDISRFFKWSYQVSLGEVRYKIESFQNIKKQKLNLFNDVLWRKNYIESAQNMLKAYAYLTFKIIK